MTTLEELPNFLLTVLVARVIQLDPNLTSSLLLVSKKVNQATCRSLYEELYIFDDELAMTSSPAETRLAAILAQPHKFGPYVRTITFVAQPIANKAFNGRLSSFKVGDDHTTAPLTSRQLGELLAVVPNLQALIWASDRPPPSQLLPLLKCLNPNLVHLYLRPSLSNQMAASCRRWNGQGLQQVDKLKALSVSFVSADGIRRMTSTLSELANLSHLTIDSQFVDDKLLTVAGEMRSLTHLVLRCTGTKITDKGITALLENSMALKSLDMREMEGRLSKQLWSNLESLPDTFKHFKMVIAEEGPHHSWISDHIEDTFALLSLASLGLRTFSITTLPPEPSYISLDESSNQHTQGLMQIKRMFSVPCDELVRARRLPDGAIQKIRTHGKNLEVLELDLFELTIEDVRIILESCKSLVHLRFLLDAPLAKLLGMSSHFVTMEKLQVLSVSLTKEYCPLPYIIQTLPEEREKSRRPSVTEKRSSESPPLSMPELSPASTHASLPFSDHEAISPTSSPQAASRTKPLPWLGGPSTPFMQLISVPIQSQPIEDTLGCINAPISTTRAPDLSIPPKREIRKLARRCPTLRKVKWYGRMGKGDWHIEHLSNSSQCLIRFAPIYVVDEKEYDVANFEAGADVEDFIISQRFASQVTTPVAESLPSFETMIAFDDKAFDMNLFAKLARVSAILVDETDLRGFDHRFPKQKGPRSQQQGESSFFMQEATATGPYRSTARRTSCPTSQFQRFCFPFIDMDDFESSASKKTYATATGAANLTLSPKSQPAGLHNTAAMNDGIARTADRATAHRSRRSTTTSSDTRKSSEIVGIRRASTNMGHHPSM